MRGGRAALTIVLAGLAACAPAPADLPELAGPLGAHAAVDRREVPLGDPIALTVTVRRDAGFTCAWPDLAKALEGFRLEPGPVTELPGEGGSTWERRRYTVRRFKAGPVTLPALEFEGRRGEARCQAATGPIDLVVRSVMEGQPEPIEKPGQVFDLPESPTWPWYAGGAMLALAIGAVAWWLHRRHRRGPPPVPVQPPHLLALERLAAIRRRPRETVAAIEALVVDTSGVIRTYIEGRYGLRAPERTTEEFLGEAGASGHLGAADREGLAAFLFECDRAKFAGWTPPPDRQSALLDTAEGFVRRTAGWGES